MFELVWIAVALVCGLTLIAIALMVLASSHAREFSVRVVSAVLIGAGGAWFVARALHAEPIFSDPGGLLLVGVSAWIWDARRRRHGAPMRRASDLRLADPPPTVDRSPWLPSRRSDR